MLRETPHTVQSSGDKRNWQGEHLKLDRSCLNFYWRQILLVFKLKIQQYIYEYVGLLALLPSPPSWFCWGWIGGVFGKVHCSRSRLAPLHLKAINNLGWLLRSSSLRRCRKTAHCFPLPPRAFDMLGWGRGSGIVAHMGGLGGYRGRSYGAVTRSWTSQLGQSVSPIQAWETLPPTI